MSFNNPINRGTLQPIQNFFHNYYMINNPRKKSCQERFLLAAGLLGFIVDSVALVAIISGLPKYEFESSPLKISPTEFTINNFSVAWFDFTLAVLAFICTMFLILTIISFITDDYSSIVLYLYIPTATILLWHMVFYPYGDSILYLHIIEIIGIGVLSAFIMSKMPKSEGCIALAIIPTITVPGIALIERGFDPTLSWWGALSLSIPLTLLGVFSPLLIVPFYSVLFAILVILAIVLVILFIALPYLGITGVGSLIFKSTKVDNASQLFQKLEYYILVEKDKTLIVLSIIAVVIFLVLVLLIAELFL